LTTEQVAEILNVSRDTVRRRRRDGSLRAARVGQLLRFAPEDVRAYVASCTQMAEVEQYLPPRRLLCPRCGDRRMDSTDSFCETCMAELLDLDEQRHEREKASKRAWWNAHAREARERQRTKAQRPTKTERQTKTPRRKAARRG
jgi:excisionase family DNA binding protein